ncbi:queuine tRNA-ribosyltransferase catalytic subunit 1 [Anaeramoeba flamelloides]|uniref:Queuine tRNA-ribosyltransferase catalytic subunit 1 n=1 Tax=Anaeramoeba flamelloides TaxID=1746091 RepID=A0AAV7Z208_9EUKA|nr:queuine tRNA-ribosyltransferase catalytic subunit [Anaeramoeba flamelloides]KAJ6240555.1 queuine tRNA-ribosyltransferase catalytic subunit 1 [Anaeramoeba flamelloides]
MSALEFEILAKSGKARTSILTLPHYKVTTPIFQPVGTCGSMKGLTSKQLKELDCQIILGNTYHLALHPGGEFFGKCGGLHEFMNWDRGLLTDSGGFQMVSLSKLAEVTEEGVNFVSPKDGSQMLLKPETSIKIQNQIGADIIMQLDDVVHVLTSGKRLEEAMYRSIRWLDRCIKAHSRKKEQNLFPIIQGGLNPELRKICLKEMIKRDCPGYAIGGLSGGESKDQFWKIVSLCTDYLPEDKPRYLMGVGFPVDLIVCSVLGVDMFDCVYPTRTSRFGTALVWEGTLKLKSEKYQFDFDPIEKDCDCLTCKTYTKSAIHTLVTKETVGCHLLTIHNIRFQMRLMQRFRESIKNNKMPEFVRGFMKAQFKKKGEKKITYPTWVIEALQSQQIELDYENDED